MLASMLACWKIGKAYLPLDPVNPIDRNRYIVENSGASLILSETQFSELTENWQVPIIYMDSDESRKKLETIVGSDEWFSVSDELPAYVMYTSGSTGVPKGVAVPRHAVRNFVLSMCNRPGITSADTVIAITTITFDIHVLELIAPLAAGAKIVLLDSESASDGFELAKALTLHDVTVMQATPSTWHLLESIDWPGKSDLKALAGGEAVSAVLVDSIAPKVQQMWNMYGPTETTVWSTCGRLEAGKTPLIGTPIDNTQVYVMDEQRKLVGVGIPGELYVSGGGLAIGYHNDTEKTAGSFVEIDVGETIRAYKTGDIVILTEHGSLKYVSRVDDQVKVRGFRIELGEIETALEQISNLTHSAAKIYTPTAGDARIVGYYVQGEGVQQSLPVIRKLLRQQLPHYMVPQHLIELSEIPLTANGKVDRKALPEPDNETVTSVLRIPAQTSNEKIVKEIWSNLIGSDDIGRNDNFFAIGGHSLLSMRFIAEIRKLTGVSISVRDVVLTDLSQIAAQLPEQEQEPGGTKSGKMTKYR
jgi:amino acid adenylation domain-containing protein